MERCTLCQCVVSEVEGSVFTEDDGVFCKECWVYMVEAAGGVMGASSLMESGEVEEEEEEESTASGMGGSWLKRNASVMSLISSPSPVKRFEGMAMYSHGGIEKLEPAHSEETETPLPDDIIMPQLPTTYSIEVERDEQNLRRQFEAAEDAEFSTYKQLLTMYIISLQVGQTESGEEEEEEEYYEEEEEEEEATASFEYPTKGMYPTPPEYISPEVVGFRKPEGYEEDEEEDGWVRREVMMEGDINEIHSGPVTLDSPPVVGDDDDEVTQTLSISPLVTEDEAPTVMTRRSISTAPNTVPPSSPILNDPILAAKITMSRTINVAEARRRLAQHHLTNIEEADRLTIRHAETTELIGLMEFFDGGLWSMLTGTPSPKKSLRGDATPPPSPSVVVEAPSTLSWRALGCTVSTETFEVVDVAPEGAAAALGLLPSDRLATFKPSSAAAPTQLRTLEDLLPWVSKDPIDLPDMITLVAVRLVPKSRLLTTPRPPLGAVHLTTLTGVRKIVLKISLRGQNNGGGGKTHVLKPSAVRSVTYSGGTGCATPDQLTPSSTGNAGHTPSSAGKAGHTPSSMCSCRNCRQVVEWIGESKQPARANKRISTESTQSEGLQDFPRLNAAASPRSVEVFMAGLFEKFGSTRGA